MTLVVKDYFTHHSEEGGIIHVLAGSPTELVPGKPQWRMLSEDAFPEGTKSRAYVAEYGILIDSDNLRDRKPTEVDTYGGWELHEDADGAWAVRLAPFGHITARKADELYGIIDDFGED